MLMLCGDRSHEAEGAYKGGLKVTPRDRGASLHSYPILRLASINTYILPTDLSSGASLLWTPFSHIECSRTTPKPLPLLPLAWASSCQVPVGAHMKCWHWRHCWEEWKNPSRMLVFLQLSPGAVSCEAFLVPGTTEQKKLGRDPDSSFVTSQLRASRGLFF